MWRLLSMLVAVTVFALLSTVSPAAASQTQREAAKNSQWQPPRTADNRPDLQGVWNFSSRIPLQRSAPLNDGEPISAQDRAEFDRLLAETQRTPRPQTENNVGGYNDFWLDARPQVADEPRPALIIDPPYGRIPPLQPGAIRQEGALRAEVPGKHPVRFQVSGIGTDSYEDRGLSERCLIGFNDGPPMVPSGYNNNMQLIQTRDHVVIHNEMAHYARIVPLDGKPHNPKQLDAWQGDSRGRWEGDTLVIETTNFTDKVASFVPSGVVALGTGKSLRVTEKFTLVDDNRLRYEFTVDDPTTFTRPFTAVMRMMRTDDRIYEYACHEGNYALQHILSGAREKERQAQSSTTQLKK